MSQRRRPSQLFTFRRPIMQQEDRKELAFNAVVGVGVVAGQAAKAAAEVAIPALGVAIALVDKIFSIAEQMRYNKKQSRRLAQSASQLVEELRVSLDGAQEEDVDDHLIDNIHKLVGTLKRVEATMRNYSGMNFVMRLIQRNAIQETLNLLDKDCQDAYALFMIKYAIDAKRHQIHNEKARQDDMTALMDELRRIMTDPGQIADKVGVRGTQVDSDSLKGVQVILHKIDNDPESIPREIRDFAEEASKTIKSRTNNDVPRTLPWFVKRSEFDVKEQIGSGGFSIVYMGYWRTTQKTVAIKIFRENSSVEDLLNEMVFWRSFDHPFLLPFLGGAPLETPAFIISPLCTKGNAITFLRQKKDADRMQILHDISRGMEYLHQQNLIHGDLKARNVLINENERALVADFGLAKYERIPYPDFRGRSNPNEESPSKTKMVPLVGTPHWLAPECFFDGQITKASDVWAFGMTAYELYTNGDIPLGHIDSKQLGKLLHDGERPARPAKLEVPDSAWALMEKTWQHEPLARPQFSQLSLVLSIYQRSDMETLRVASEDLQKENWAEGELPKWPGLAECLVGIITFVLQIGPIQSAEGKKDNFSTLSQEAQDHVLYALKVLNSLAKACEDDPSVGQIIVSAGALKPLLFILQDRSKTLNPEIVRLGCEITSALVPGHSNDTFGDSITSTDFLTALMTLADGSQHQKVALATARTLLSNKPTSEQLLSQKRNAIKNGVISHLVNALPSDDAAAIEEALRFIQLLDNEPSALEDEHLKLIAPALNPLVAHSDEKVKNISIRTIAKLVYGTDEYGYLNHETPAAVSNKRWDVFIFTGLFNSMMDMAETANESYLSEWFDDGPVRPTAAKYAAYGWGSGVLGMFCVCSSAEEVTRLLQFSERRDKRYLQILALYLLQQIGQKVDKETKDKLNYDHEIVDKLMAMLNSPDNLIASYSSDAIAVFAVSEGIDLLLRLMKIETPKQKRLNMKILNDIIAHGEETEAMAVVRDGSILPYVCDILKEEPPINKGTSDVAGVSDLKSINPPAEDSFPRFNDKLATEDGVADAGNPQGSEKVATAPTSQAGEEPAAGAQVDPVDIPREPVPSDELPDARLSAIKSLQKLTERVSDDHLPTVADVCLDCGIFGALVDLLDGSKRPATEKQFCEDGDFLSLVETLISVTTNERRVRIAQTPLLKELSRTIEQTSLGHASTGCCNILHRLLSSEENLDERIISAILDSKVLDRITQLLRKLKTKDKDPDSTEPIVFGSRSANFVLCTLLVSLDEELWTSLEKNEVVDTLKASFNSLSDVDDIFVSSAYMIVEYLDHPKTPVKKLGLHVLGFMLKGDIHQRKTVSMIGGMAEALEGCLSVDDEEVQKLAREAFEKMPTKRTIRRR